MKTLIPKDFKPNKKTYNNLRLHGAIPEFVDYELPNMITYFTELAERAVLLKEMAVSPQAKISAIAAKKKAVKASWQMTCQVWMRSAFKGKAGRDWEYDRDKSRMYRMPENEPPIRKVMIPTKSYRKYAEQKEPPEIRLKDYQQEMIDNIKS